MAETRGATSNLQPSPQGSGARRPGASAAPSERPQAREIKNGGEGGIRTHETIARPPVFETGAFSHSATSPNHKLSAERRLVACNPAACKGRIATTFSYRGKKTKRACAHHYRCSNTPALIGFPKEFSNSERR